MVERDTPNVIPPFDPYNEGQRIHGDVRAALDVHAVDGHVSTAGHTHIHRHLNELYFSGSEGVLSGVGETDQDLIIRNPSDSGNTVEVVGFRVTASVGYDTEQYYNATYPETTGTPDGTEITPWNLCDHSVAATFEAQHTPTGDSTDLVDETTADRQIPVGIVGGTKQNPTPTEVTGGDPILNPGETLLFRTGLDGANEDIAYVVLVAEYETGRSIS